MKRYDFEARTRYGRVQWTEVEWDGGGWVRHADHAAALAERDALLVRAELALVTAGHAWTCAPENSDPHAPCDCGIAATLAALREHIAGGKREGAGA